MSPLAPANGTGNGTSRTVPVPAFREVDPNAVDLAREYVAGGVHPFYDAYVRSLPPWIDDISRDLGDIYERMMLDPVVASSVATLKAGSLADGIHLTPAVTADDDPDTADPDADLAKEIRDFCQRNLDQLDEPIEQILAEMLDALAFGNVVAEKVYRLADSGPDAGKLMLAAIRPKPRKSVAFAVDPFGNVAGILAVIPGRSYSIQLGSDVANASNLLPRSKFAVLSFMPRRCDPRGTSVLRPAYAAWNMKLQAMGEHFKYVTQFAGPSLVGTMPPKPVAVPEADAAGKPIPGKFVPFQSAFMGQLLEFRNGCALVIPNGAAVTPIHPQGEGGAFHKGFEYWDRQIAHAILGSARVSLEARHGSRADSQTGENVTALLVTLGKRAVRTTIRRDLLFDLVLLNYGADAARRLTPLVSTGETAPQNWSGIASAVAALVNAGFIDPSQYRDLDAKLGLPPRSAESVQAAITAQQIKMETESSLEIAQASGAPSGDGQSGSAVIRTQSP